MSALPPKADIGTQPRDVRFVPKEDSCGAAKRGDSCSFRCELNHRLGVDALLVRASTLNDSAAAIFMSDPEDANLDCEIADETLEAVAQIGGGMPNSDIQFLLLYLRQ